MDTLSEKLDQKLQKAVDEALAKEKEAPKLRSKDHIVADYWELARSTGDIEYRVKLLQSQLQENYVRMNKLDAEPYAQAPEQAPALSAVPDAPAPVPTETV